MRVLLMLWLGVSYAKANVDCKPLSEIPDPRECLANQDFYVIRGACDQNHYEKAFCSDGSYEPGCTNANLVDLPPCFAGEKLVYIMGSCRLKDQYESIHCEAIQCFDLNSEDFPACSEAMIRTFIQGNCSYGMAQASYCAPVRACPKEYYFDSTYGFCRE